MYIRKDWFYLDWRKYLYIDIRNPKKTLNKVKNVFKPLQCKFRFSKNIIPNPVLWCSNPALIHIIFNDVGWKDKYDSPRFERVPYVWIHLFKWNFVWYWTLFPHQEHKEYEYWEQVLWYLYYYNNTSYGCNEPNIEKAKESWPWEDYKTKQSTWSDEFLVK